MRVTGLFFALIVGRYAHVLRADWNGDPSLCTVDDSINDDRPQPQFSSQAEFVVQRVETKTESNVASASEISVQQYFYDFDANRLLITKNKNGFIDKDDFHYETLKKSTYYQDKICVVSDIPRNVETDGTSAIQMPSSQWHVRPLNELLLFSNVDPQRPIVRPTYKGRAVVRGIPVDQWQSCVIDRAQLRTTRRVWSVAQSTVTVPNGLVGKTTVPVQRALSVSVLLANGTKMESIEQLLNVYSYRSNLTKSFDQFFPPEGVLCHGASQQSLHALREMGITWPDRFSVRIEASSSRNSLQQRFHLRYEHERDSRRIQYDFSPDGSDQWQSVIHDYAANVTYTIDRQSGSCKVDRGVEYPDVSPTADPIQFLVKHQHRLMLDTQAKVWTVGAFRVCRGVAIGCMILNTAIDRFPPMMDSQVNETWPVTNVEYGWSRRSPFTHPILDGPRPYDYPVYLSLKFYAFADPTNPLPSNTRIEHVNYQFFEMSHDLQSSDFDTTACYRALDLPYVQLGLVLQANDESLVDSSYMDRRVLERLLRNALLDELQVSSKRVNQLQLDHIRSDKSVYVLFTLLGPTPLSNNDELSIQSAQQHLQTTIDAGRLTFNITLADNDRSQMVFRAKANSLQIFRRFMPIHASSVSAVSGSQHRQEKYATAAQVGSIVGGLTVGIMLGVIVLVLSTFVTMKPTPTAASAAPSGFSNIGFRTENVGGSYSMQNLQETVRTSDSG